jgi:predicted RNA-binding Zn-ribbon protein involved in translation (DUF1610 family)
MDDLDRMFRRLVQNIRNGYPEYLTRPFEVSELYQNLIPYRHNRRELAIETNQDYEMALCRLLAGERGYLQSDDAMAEAIRGELASANPNTAVFREFAASRVALAPTAERRWRELGGDLSSAPTPEAPVTPAAPPTPTAPMAASPSPAAPPASTPAASAPAAAAPRVADASRGDAGSTCRYCGMALPGGRRATYCPHCGQNLMIRRCEACGTELDVSWKFCITCGRGTGVS